MQLFCIDNADSSWYITDETWGVSGGKKSPFPRFPTKHSPIYQLIANIYCDIGKELKNEMQERTLYDFPTISMREASEIFMMGEPRFRKRFEECLHRYIRSVKMLRGQRLLLVDVFRAAYPEAPESVIYELAYRYTVEWHSRRAELVMRGKRKAMEEKANA